MYSKSLQLGMQKLFVKVILVEWCTQNPELPSTPPLYWLSTKESQVLGISGNLADQIFPGYSWLSGPKLQSKLA